MSIDWKHPVVVLLIGSTVTLLGWFGREYFLPERGSDARVEAQDVHQPPPSERRLLNTDSAAPKDVGQSKSRGVGGGVTAPDPHKFPTKESSSDSGAVLNAATTGRKQAIDLLDATPPTYRGRTVFCDTVRLTLVLDQQGRGTKPVLIHRIAFRSESVPEIAHDICHIDPLSSRPAGIAEKDLYVLSLRPARTTARYLKSGREGEAWPVSPNNLLRLRTR